MWHTAVMVKVRTVLEVVLYNVRNFQWWRKVKNSGKEEKSNHILCLPYFLDYTSHRFPLRLNPHHVATFRLTRSVNLWTTINLFTKTELFYNSSKDSSKIHRIPHVGEGDGVWTLFTAAATRWIRYLTQSSQINMGGASVEIWSLFSTCSSVLFSTKYWF